MHLSSLQLADFRNYAALSLSLPSEGALFTGPNGSGKSNLLEAIHVLCVGRSQRGARRAEMIRNGAAVACVSGSFASPGREPETGALIGFDRDGHTNLSLEGRKVPSLRDWFGHAAVVSFGPDDLQLITANPALRRRFLDMLICQIDTDYLDHLIAYQRALRNRNRLLAEDGDETLMEVFESAMAKHGSYLDKVRTSVVLFCRELFAGFYRGICGGKESAGMRFSPCFSPGESGVSRWEDVFFNTLKNKRKQDMKAGFSTVGPHRDDLHFFLNEKPARNFASQGQCRSLALSLRLVSVRCIEQYSKEPMIFLVDDAFSELDDGRAAAVYPLLRAKGQLFMASPTDRTVAGADLPRFAVGEGRVTAR